MKSYLITDPNIYTNNTNIFRNILTKILKYNQIDYICFRDKQSLNYIQLAKSFVNIAKNNNIQNIFINQYIDLAISFQATGVHLTSNQFDKISYVKNMNLKVIISCHNEDDIQKAISSKVDYITYSPIFNTPNKGKAIGLAKLSYIVQKYKSIKIFALGGITNNENIKLIKQSKSYGFSSIRYFI
jgi:thiamine-phosphate pyrophosphorylase